MEYLAKPIWVNLLYLIPVAAYFLLRASGRLDKNRLWLVAIFGVAFGLVEAAVVIYLRASTGLFTQPTQTLLPSIANTFLEIEVWREAATMVMLLSIAMLASQNWKSRIIYFLWVFAFWDLFYYVFLKIFISWPPAWTTPDVLFLIPVPWLAQVWFPILIDAVTIGLIIFL